MTPEGDFKVIGAAVGLGMPKVVVKVFIIRNLEMSS